MTVSNEDGPKSATAGSDYKILQKPGSMSEQSEFGRFEVRGILGEGSYGKVCRAYDTALHREVALKLPKFRSDEERAVERFLREAKAAARLRHPNIVAVFESGRVGNEYYIAAEFVDGETLAARIERNRPDFRTCAAWCRDLSRALAYAHDCGVVHRDIKPGNILVDHAGRLQITDFGLAKRVDEDATMTNEGGLLGTPAYMSPEQARGLTSEIGPASDQYSLGTVLFELLTGQRPYDGAPHVIIARVAGTEPVPRPRGLRPETPRDLEAICMRSLEKDPERRYRNLQAMADDLDRWLEGRPVHVRRIGEAERLWRWCKRNPAVATSLFTTLGLILAIVSGAFTKIIVDKNRAIADSEQATQELEQFRERSAQDDSDELRLGRLVRTQVLSGTRRYESGDIYGALPYFVEALRRDSGNRDRERQHRIRIASVLDAAPNLVRQWELEGCVTSICFSPDGNLLAAATGERSNAKSVAVWHISNGSAAYAPLMHDGPVLHVGFSPDGGTIVSSSADHTTRLWIATTGQPKFEPLRHNGPVAYAEFSSDGKKIVTAGHDQAARIWDAETGKPSGNPLQVDRPMQSAHFSKNGLWLATVQHYMPFGVGNFAIWDLKSGERIHTLPNDNMPFLALPAYSPDERILACPGGRAVRLFNLETKKVVQTLLHDNHVFQAVFSPDGRTLATSTEDAKVYLWNPDNGRMLSAPLEHDGGVHCIQFTQDGRRLLSVSADAAQIWDTTTWLRIVPPLRHSDRLTGAVHSPNGRQIATAGRDGLVRLWNLPSEAPHSWKQVGKDKLDTAPIAFTDQSRKLATIGFGTDGAFRIYDRASNALSYPAISTQPKTQLGNFSPDGRYFIVTLTTGDVQLFQTIDGKPSGAPLSHGSPLNGITYSPDGKYLVTSTSDNKVRVWDLDSRTLANGPFQMKGWISALGISPDTSCIGVAEISRWRSLNRATGADIFPPVEVKGEILDLAFSPDGSMLAVAVRESLVANGWGLVFDAMTGKPITAPLRHVNPVGKVAWHPDGTILATGDFFGSVRLWQIPTSTPLCDYLSHPDNIVRLQFSTDGRVLFADASNGPFSSRVWDGRTGEPLGPPRLPGMQTSDAIMGADGRYLALRSGDNRVFAVELKEDARSVDEIYRISKLLSARIVDAAGTSVPVTKSELIEGWKVFGETLQAGADFNGAMVNSKSMTPAQSAR